MRTLLAAVAAVAITGSLTAATSAPDDDLWLADHLAKTTSGQQALAHLRVFERIADEDGGQRATATPGFAASARYVTEQLTAAGYRVKSQTVPYRQFVFDAESGRETAPHARTIRTLMLDGSPVTPKGGLTAPLVLAPVKADGTSGCTAADYDGLPVRGAIVLTPRSSCGYADQQKVIAGLGGLAMLMYLPVPDPENIYRLHVFTPSDFTIPSATISPAQAGQLSADAAQHPVTFHLELRGHVADKKTVNLFAETRGGSADHIVMAYAHLDSVPEGPGIDDNASSVAALLATAKRLAPFQNRVRDKVRFAFWGAEEQVDVGSDYYVEHLSSAERAAIDLYENFELIASPNFARFLIDGDVPEAPGSATVTKVFEQYFTRGKPAVRDRTGDGRRLGPGTVRDGRHRGRRDGHGHDRPEDAGGGRDVRRAGGAAVRPLLSPDVRPGGEPEPSGPGRERARDRLDHRPLRHGHLGRAPGQGHVAAAGTPDRRDGGHVLSAGCPR